MAFRLSDALKRSFRAFTGGAPPRDTRGPSPQALSNINQERARQFRRSSFAPRGPQINAGVVDPFFRQRAPISPEESAQEVVSRFGGIRDATGAPAVTFGGELNRFTAPDPEAFARGARAPEFVESEIGLDRADVRGAELSNLAETERLPFIASGLRQGEAVTAQELEAATATEQRAADLFPSELTTAEQGVQQGVLDIRATEAGLAGAPSAEELAEDREIARLGLRTQAEQGGMQQQLDAMESDIASLEAQGDFDGANQVRQRRDALLDNRVGPPAPGGAPPISTGQTNQVLIQRNDEIATSVGSAAGLLGEEGALKALEQIADETGFPSRDTVGLLESAAASIGNAIANASDAGPRPTPQDIIRAKIKTSKGYIALKRRTGSLLGGAVKGALEFAVVPKVLTGSRRPQDLSESQDIARQIIDLVEPPQQLGGAPSF